MTEAQAEDLKKLLTEFSSKAQDLLALIAETEGVPGKDMTAGGQGDPTGRNDGVSPLGGLAI